MVYPKSKISNLHPNHMNLTTKGKLEGEGIMSFTDDQSLVREKGMREKRWGISWVRERKRKKR